MAKDIELFVRECDICQRHKIEHVPLAGLLQPLPIPTQAWSHITIDFIEGLSNSNGKQAILVVVDRLTK